jgi:hypothetical protein
MPLNLDWIAGFTEGEGTFTFHQHYNNTTVNGERVYYFNPMPTFQISQKHREVLDEICAYFEEKGIHGKVYHRNYTKGNGEGAWEYRVVGKDNCLKVAKLLTPFMHVPHKIKQAEGWIRKILMIQQMLALGLDPYKQDRDESFQLAEVVDPTEYEK